MVYINTLMIQEILNSENLNFTAQDFRALSPLIHGHLTPYGYFTIDLVFPLNTQPTRTLMTTRTPVREKAKQFAKLLLKENPDYNYLRELFRHLRQELEITPGRKEQRLPYVPTEEDVIKFYKVVWESKNTNDVLVIKTRSEER